MITYKRRSFVLAGWFMLFLLAMLLLGSAAGRRALARPEHMVQGEQVIPGFPVLVKLNSSPQTSDGVLALSDLNQYLAVSEPATLQPVFNLEDGDVDLKRLLGLDRYYRIIFSSQADALGFLETTRQNQIIASSTLDGVGVGAGFPDDPSFGQQYYFHNSGQDGGKVDADIDASEAWEISTGSSGTVIAVLDTGIDLNHPDLRGKLISGYDFVNLDDHPMDDHGHGTLVSGIAAAKSSNQKGGAGTCWECTLMAVKVLDSGNAGYYSWWAQGVEYAVDNDVDVINMSLVGTNPEMEVLLGAVRYAYMMDIPIAASMGNRGDDTPTYPAAFPETIAVGATDRQDCLWESSNHNSYVDLVAPGVEIYNTVWDNTYYTGTGTSLSTPQVSGVLGLMENIYPDLPIEELRRILRITAEDQVCPGGLDTPGWDSYYGFGRLNAFQALRDPFSSQVFIPGIH
jgi:subtilisin family serine protease